MRYVELLAPAKNLACGKAAIDHGADAVYVGASRFGARASAGNSLGDISELCRYAHLFGARVYVTVNTIIYDSEFRQTTALVEQLQQVGVDAILVQDMGLLSHLASHPEQITIPLHASTQTDNRSAEKVEWLRSLGIRRAVPRSIVCKLFRSLLCVGILFPSQCQPRRVRPVLPHEVQPEGQQKPAD